MHCFPSPWFPSDPLVFHRGAASMITQGTSPLNRKLSSCASQTGMEPKKKARSFLCSTSVVEVQMWKNRQAQIKVGVASDGSLCLTHVRRMDDIQAMDQPRIRWPWQLHASMWYRIESWLEKKQVIAVHNNLVNMKMGWPSLIWKFAVLNALKSSTSCSKSLDCGTFLNSDFWSSAGKLYAYVLKHF